MSAAPQDFSGTRRHLLGAMASGIAFAHIPQHAQAAPAPAAQKPPPVYGKKEAPKRLVVWGSYTCPYTAMLFTVLKPIVSDLKDVVSVEWRHFPTHPPDPALHVAGLSLEDEHFWNFTFHVLGFIYAAGGQYTGLTRAKILELAKIEGGSEASLKAAYGDPAKWAAVKQDLMAGKLLGITRTPGLFHNGYFMTPDGIPRDMKAFDTSLRAMLQAG